MTIRNGHPRELEAERFILRDKDGTKKAELFCNEEGNATLMFGGLQGGMQIVEHAEGLKIELYGADGPRIRFTVEKDHSGIVLYDIGSSEAPALIIGTSINGGPGVMLLDQEGKPRVTLIVADNPRVDICNAKGKVTHSLPPKKNRR